MSYNKNNTAGLELSTWLKTNLSKLLQLGIPEPILKSRHRWNHLLDHGYDAETDWDFRQLTSAEAGLLLTSLNAHFPKDHWACLAVLPDFASQP